MFKSLLKLLGVEVVVTTEQQKLLNIIDYEFPTVVKERTKEELKISDSILELVEISLKDYFYILKNEKTYVNKNSTVEMLDFAVDVLWHNFILDTKSYSEFCNKYIGFFIHHIPYETKKTLTNDQLEKHKKIYLRNLISTKNRNYDYLKARIDLLSNNKHYIEITKSLNATNDDVLAISLYENYFSFFENKIEDTNNRIFSSISLSLKKQDFIIKSINEYKELKEEKEKYYETTKIEKNSKEDVYRENNNVNTNNRAISMSFMLSALMLTDLIAEETHNTSSITQTEERERSSSTSSGCGGSGFVPTTSSCSGGSSTSTSSCSGGSSGCGGGCGGG